jgi:hypothetical protein
LRKRVPVIIQWDRDKLRNLPIAGRRYTTMAKFPDKQANDNSAWSIILHFPENVVRSEEKMMGEAEFLVDEAPWHWLVPGTTFEMYEGFQKTATVVTVL